jgi:hypothetical protein
MATAARLFGSLWPTAVDFALPPRCPCCGLIVDGDHRFYVSVPARPRCGYFAGPACCAMVWVGVDNRDRNPQVRRQ